MMRTMTDDTVAVLDAARGGGCARAGRLDGRHDRPAPRARPPPAVRTRSRITLLGVEHARALGRDPEVSATDASARCIGSRRSANERPKLRFRVKRAVGVDASLCLRRSILFADPASTRVGSGLKQQSLCRRRPPLTGCTPAVWETAAPTLRPDVNRRSRALVLAEPVRLSKRRRLLVTEIRRAELTSAGTLGARGWPGSGSPPRLLSHFSFHFPGPQTGLPLSTGSRSAGRPGDAQPVHRHGWLAGASDVGDCDAHDRPDPSVCGLGSARLLLSSRRRGPHYRNGDTSAQRGSRCPCSREQSRSGCGWDRPGTTVVTCGVRSRAAPAGTGARCVGVVTLCACRGLAGILGRWMAS